MLRRLLATNPWPIVLGVLVPFVLATAWLQDRGVRLGCDQHGAQHEGHESIVDAGGLLEYWVHGLFEPWSWVPYIHPPLYSVLMNSADFYAGWFDLDVYSVIIGHAALAHVLVVVFVAWFLWRELGAGWAQVGAAMVAFSPNWVRPFENYPVGSALMALAAIAILNLAIHGSWSAFAVAVFAALAAVELHLSNWFCIGGLMAGMFFLVKGRRIKAALASILMIGLFMLSTFPGLWQVIEEGPDADAEATVGGMTLEWTNPLLYLPLIIWLAPPLIRRMRVPASAACGVLLFTAVSLGLQHFQLADGQPYPYCLHYFELVDTPLILAGVLALAALSKNGGERLWLQRGVILLAGLLVVSQFALYCWGQRYVLLSEHTFLEVWQSL
jgi:hypothetical protein